MFSWRLLAALTTAVSINLNVSTCRSPGENGSGDSPGDAEPKDVKLPGIDTAELTTRERQQWSGHVSELLAPCKDQPVSLAQCVTENRACKACLPAAKFLLTQVRQGRTTSLAEAAYRARFSPDQVKQIDLDGSPSKGPDSAAVTIVEWADFECPACRAAKPMIEEVMAKYPSGVRLVFKHFPLAIHENAEKAARAAVAAQRQGKFWEMHHGLFTKDPPLNPPVLERIAKSANLDVATWKADLESEAVADVVARDRKLGEQVELTGTPTIFINGRRFVSAGDQQADLLDWVSLELELLGATETAQKPAPAQKAPAPSGSVGAPAASLAAPPAPAPPAPAPAGSAAPATSR
ncbi:MAG TPA: DsbA family protein [Polyangiaceae bacterium]